MLACNQLIYHLFQIITFSFYPKQFSLFKILKGVVFSLTMGSFSILICILFPDYLTNFLYLCIFFLLLKLFYNYDEKESSIIVYSYGVSLWLFNMITFPLQSNIIKLFIFAIVSLMVSKMIHIYLFHKNSNSIISHECALILVTSAFFIATYPIISQYYQLISFIYSALVFYYVIKKSENEQIFHALLLEIKSLEITLDNTRVFRHDYNNNLCAIGGYISVDDMNGLRSFYSKISEETMNHNSFNRITFKSVNEPSIYALLLNKYRIIQKSKVQLDFDSSINYTNMSVSPFELCKVLGILLDNAIEASKASLEKKIIISCKNSTNHQKIIKISNTYLNKEVDLQKIFDKGYSSKEVKSGLGLWEVKNFIDSNTSLQLNTYKNEDLFTQELTII